MTASVDLILAINSGSSSLKCGLYPHPAVGFADPVAELRVTGIGQSSGKASFWQSSVLREVRPGRYASIRDAMAELRSWLEIETDIGRVVAVGHRVVRGPLMHSEPRRLDQALLEELKALVPLAPLHLPQEIECLEVCRQQLDGIPHVVCFDHDFYRDLPDPAARLPLPRQWFDMGIRRIGYHGLSYEYVRSRIPNHPRTVLAHLGAGASMTALRDGQPVETTMGLTPTGGLMMATRSGDLDPGVVLEVVRQLKPDFRYLSRFFNRQGGWKAVSGGIEDMRELLAARGTSLLANQAVESFLHSARKHLGGLIAVLGGLDCLVFTGGVGEQADAIRAGICQAFGFLGLALDPAANNAHAEVISTADSQCEVRVVATDENAVIASHTGRVTMTARETVA